MVFQANLVTIFRQAVVVVGPVEPLRHEAGVGVARLLPIVPAIAVRAAVLKQIHNSAVIQKVTYNKNKNCLKIL